MYLRADHLHFTYSKRAILHDVSCGLERGKVYAIIGPNGAGKSTLLKCMLALITPLYGTVWLDGSDVRRLSRQARAKKQGYVPQQTTTAFRLSVMEMVLLGRKPFIQFAPQPRDIAIVESLIDYLSLRHLADRSVDELSGGERQKVVLARALAQEPEALFLDEPTAALDIRHQIEVMNLVQELAQTHNKLVVLVLHDLTLAARYCDELLLMKDGRVHAAGTPDTVLTTTHIREVYGVDAEVRRGRFGLEIQVAGISETQALPG